MGEKKHLVFVTEELYPFVPGGLGRFIDNAIKELYQYYEISIIIPNISGIDIKERLSSLSYNFNIITENISFSFPYWNEKGSYYLKEILALHKQKPIDYIEFYDFGGSALETLLYRQNKSNEIENIKIFIRHHMTIGEITEVETPHIPNYFVLYITKREKEAIKSADGIIAQSIAYSKKIDNDNIFISYPPVSKLKSFYNPIDNIENGENILYFGKLQQCKNIEVLLDALVLLLKEKRLNFRKCILVGHIVPYSFKGYITYYEELLSHIPIEFQDKFLFLGAWELEKLPEIAKNVKLAVIPSNIESFCLSAHELSSYGIPLILKDIGTYNDFFQEARHCELFKESFSDLALKIESLWERKDDLLSMSKELSALKYPNFVTTYENILSLPPRRKKEVHKIDFSKALLFKSFCNVVCSKNLFAFLEWIVLTKQWKKYLRYIRK